MKLKDAWLIPARVGLAIDQFAGLCETGNGVCEAVGTLVGDNDKTLRAIRDAKPKAELKDYYPINHFNPMGRD